MWSCFCLENLAADHFYLRQSRNFLSSILIDSDYFHSSLSQEIPDTGPKVYLRVTVLVTALGASQSLVTSIGDICMWLVLESALKQNCGQASWWSESQVVALTPGHHPGD